jgi:hypothetical protein
MGSPGYESSRLNLHDSILGAEVVASRRLLTQLNPQSTRVGIITFAKDARLVQPLTNDFEQVRRVLDEVYWAGPNGGTNMVEGIRLGISELLGIGQSAKRQDAIKVQFFLTDGLPSLPTVDGRGVAETDVQLTVNAAAWRAAPASRSTSLALAKKSSTFLGRFKGSPKASDTYTPLARPADVLAIMDQFPSSGSITCRSLTRPLDRRRQTCVSLPTVSPRHCRWSRAKNQIDVLARASGKVKQPGFNLRLLPIRTQSRWSSKFFSKEKKKLKLEVDRLGKSPEEIQRDASASNGKLAGPNSYPSQ